MKFLLDTCAALWMFVGSARISSSMRDLLTDPDNKLFISDVSLMECVIQYQVGKLELSSSPSQFLPDMIRKHDMNRLSLNPQNILAMENLPMHHRDPFDRLLIAQATHDDLTLVTPDPLIARYPVKRLWV